MRSHITAVVAAALVVAAAALAACSPQDEAGPAATTGARQTASNTAVPAPPGAPSAQHADDVRRMKIEELRDQLGSDKIVVYDVRDQKAYDLGHIKGAKLVPFSEVGKRLADFPKDKLIVTYCA